MSLFLKNTFLLHKFVFGKVHFSLEKYIRTRFKGRLKGTFKSTVLWLSGETGIGKSRIARQIQEATRSHAWSCYSKSGSNKWFDGYSGDELVIWDELNKDFPFTLLLQILDRYELRVETKGGYKNFNPKLIIITTNYSPEEIYCETDEKHMNALKRRINHYIQFTGPIYTDLIT